MSTEITAVKPRVRDYILHNLLFSDDAAELPDDASLLDRGIIDSTGVLEVVMFIEETFGLHVKASDMLPENFDTVNAIAAFVERQRQAVA